MATHVGKSFEGSVTASDDDRGLVRDVQHLEITGLRQLGLMTSKNPVAANYSLELELKNGRVSVETLIERVALPVAGDQLGNSSGVLAHP